MSERASDIKARLETVDQLEAVITAMRSIAAARTRQARERLDGIRAYAQTIGTAIGQSLAFLPDQEFSVPATAASSADIGVVNVVIALTAEQGFAGAFSDRVLDKSATCLDDSAPRVSGNELMLVGDRGLMVATERNLPVTWSAPMAAHVDDVPALANRIADALYPRMLSGQALHVSLIHGEPDPSEAVALVERTLLPFDFNRFPGTARSLTPLVTMPPEHLIERLAEEYIFAELCAALMLSFAAENEARMRAMIGARSNVRRTRDKLRATFRQLRQEQITTEIVELAGGRLAQAGSGRQHRNGPA